MASALPTSGQSSDHILAEIAERRSGDLDWRGGRAFSLVYNAADPELEALQHRVADDFMHENALNPFAYPSLRSMEAEILAMAGEVLGGDARAGALSSGGTESIFLAVQTARDHGRDLRGIGSPNVVVPSTVHPAFPKACKYLGVEMVRVAVGPDLRADVGAMIDGITPDTVMVVGSAPCYPFGVIDPIVDLASAAAERGVLCHVDACLGGWLLPFWEQIGEPVPPWDLSVPGVTSLSADLHKYGYAFKGVSVVMYADRALLKRQHFFYDDWPGGMYGSATTAGTRPAPPIAAAWATMRFLGRDGYRAKAQRVRTATKGFQTGIRGLDGLEITGDPDMSVFEFSATHADIFAIGDVMDERGWGLDRQQGGLHLMVSPGHDVSVNAFVEDLGRAVADHGESSGRQAIYGGVAE